MGAFIKLAKPRDPETKGRIERANGYFGSSFEPARTFATIDDFNDQIDDWLEVKANSRIVRATGQAPVLLLPQERAAMAPLPAVMPQGLIELRTRLNRDYYVRVASCDYSVDPRFIGKFVDVRASLTRVWVTCEGQTIADHPRCFVPRQQITDPEHVEIAAKQRSHFQSQMAKASQGPKLVLVEHRDLATYDNLYQLRAA
jgi:hypothetical protein